MAVEVRDDVLPEVLSWIEFKTEQAKRRMAFKAATLDIDCGRGCLGLLIPAHQGDVMIPVMPDPPEDFKGYLPNRLGPFLLQELHPRSRDSRLSFVEAEHQYFIDGLPSLGSVTGLVHRFAEPFVPEVVIDKMVTGSCWPRAQYLKEDVADAISRVDSLFEVPELKTLVHEITEAKLPSAMVCDRIKELGCRMPAIRELLYSTVAMDSRAIMQKWEDCRDEASGRGTYMHQQFEYYLNRGVVDCAGPEMSSLLKYLSTLVGWCAYRTEWMIFGSDEWLAGCIDFAAIDASGSMMLVDWKRSRGLASKYKGYGRFMAGPLEHVPDCTGWRYRLQLNCYRYILEKYYACEVSVMCVVCTHPENTTFPFVDVVPHMFLETEAVMSHQRQLASQFITSAESQ